MRFLPYSAIVCFCAVSAHADLYHFQKLTGNESVNVASQLLADISDAGGGKVNFKFSNQTGTSSSITGVYFDLGDILSGISGLSGSSGVDFRVGGPPANPASSSLNPLFKTSARATTKTPKVSYGVNTSSEYLNVTLSLKGGKDYQDLIDALNEGSLHIGLQVQTSLKDGDLYVNLPNQGRPVVPSPDAAILGVLGLGWVGFLRRPNRA